MSKVIVKIQNDYSDGHHSEREVKVDAPNAEDLDSGDLYDWYEGVVFPHTGDGHGASNPELGTCYTATILSGDVPEEWIGDEWEWV